MKESSGSRLEPPPVRYSGGGEARLVAPPAEAGQPPRRSGAPRGGALGSLALHLALLLALLLHPPAGHAPSALQPIPVRLVVLKPPPKPRPKPAPKPPAKPPPAAERRPLGRIASVEMGPKPEKIGPAEKPAAAKPASPPAPTKPPAPPPPTKSASPPPPAKSPSPPTLAKGGLPPAPTTPHSPPAGAEPAKAPAKPPLQTAMAVPVPLEKPPAPPETRPLHRQGRAIAAARAEALPRYPGPSASKDAYLAYLAALIRRHVGLLTRPMVGSRRGVTIIGITVLDNGTIARLYVIKSSGYPDIDRRIEMMVAAVGRFPPLPQLWQGPQVDLDFHMPVPEALPQ